LRKAIRKIGENNEERYTESLEILRRQNEDLASETESGEVWVGPYTDMTYTWGRLSGDIYIDIILLIVSFAIVFLLVEIVRQTQALW